ncbi:MAG: hypothetical protein MRY74_00475 [Neomegalonema sp.]|nr:hypothetical protein [Neomegalonema sp.]
MRAAKQHGDNSLFCRERFADFKKNEVVFIVAHALDQDVNPAWADERQNDIGLKHLPLKNIEEIVSRFEQPFNVHKQSGLIERGVEYVKEKVRVRSVIAPSIVEEYLRLG